MKRGFLLSAVVLMLSISAYAQNDKTKYPDPEYSNEVYAYRKDSVNKLLRLEKDHSKMQTKTKLMGMGGVENGYTIEGDQSPVRFTSGKDLSFIYYDNSASAPSQSSPKNDSMMRANGVDPSMMEQFKSMNNPDKTLSLYKLEVTKGKRKVYLMKSGPALPFSAKNKSSDKISISVKKIREGYWEIVVDKSLSKGEYCFTYSGMGMNNMDGGVSIFAFAVD